jgi:hypothetical protein
VAKAFRRSGWRRCATGYVVAEDKDGQTYVVPPGSRLPASDPVVKANPDLFKPAK